MPLDARRRRAVAALEDPSLLEQEDFLPTSPTPELDAPARVPLTPRAMPGAEVDHELVPAEMPTPVDTELDAARGADVDAFNSRAEEMALRQIVAGITRTQAPGPVSQLGTAEQQLQTQRRQSKLDSIRQLEAQDNIARADAYGRQVDQNALSAKDRDKRAVEGLAQRKEELDQRSNAQKARDIIAQGELERRKAADAVKAKALAKKGSAPPALADEVPFGATTFQYQGDPAAMKELKLAGGKAVREKAAQWNTTVAGLNQLEKALSDFIKSPTPQNKSLLYGPALAAAGSTNAAIGQGAMSADEKNAQFQALGVSFGDAAGLQALVERAFSDPSASEDVLRRVRQMKQLANQSVTAAAESYNYRPKGAGPAAATEEMISVLNKETGQRGKMPKSKFNPDKYEMIK